MGMASTVHMCIAEQPRRVVLDDHARLPWRFFGRMTAAVPAGL